MSGVIIAGRYRLVEKLGAGGMGAVWLAHDLSLDSPCAVKLIDPEKSRSDEVRKRFVREAKAAAQLRGPHVVDVFDRGESDGILYIAMEYLEGEDLCARLGRVGLLEPERAYRIIAHVARALSSAHALGIVHRDLKPENIYLVQSYDEEIAKVLDFGIAQHASYHLEDHATREGSFLGTPYYVSPEQARGRPTDHRSDLWSLGVITYQCLTGMTPFDSDSLGELMGLILYDPIPRITEANPDLPPAVEDWWSRATQRDRELRFQSARELADRLGAALEIKTIVSVPTLPPRLRPPSMGDVRDSWRTLASAGAGARSLPPIPEPTVRSFIQASGQESALLTPQDPLLVTNLAVTRTRPSFQSVRDGIEWGCARIKASPKQALIAVALGIGVVLGAIATLAASTRTVNVTALGPESQASTPQQVPLASAPRASRASAEPAAQEVYPGPEVLPVPSADDVDDLPAPRAPSTRRSPVPGSQSPRKSPASENPWGI
ncbi:MAG: protein kinase domain-containing protein [Myxococcales bacterium]